MPAPLRIAIDTGGTFTDCVWVEGGRLRMVKVFSTPDDPSRAIVEAVKRTGVKGPVLLLHGTTVGTNALLERKGARVAFVTTAGFEDTIEIGRQNRPQLYNLEVQRVAPLVASEQRFGVRERVSPDGSVTTPLEDQELRRLREELLRNNPEAIAVSLLFSFANPVHEQRIAETLASLGRPVSLSHQILPEFREYERASTVVINAYLQPLMSSYLQSLKERLCAVQKQSRVFVMQSSGGIAPLEVASREPVRTVLSGPAGGVVGCAALARQSGFSRVIGFDMGGTSTDVCLVDGEVPTSNEAEIAGYPVRVPMLAIHTVGAGGGSIARFDAAGALRVGPESAGADPGPICYGKGMKPTVTDANLLLGRLRPDRFLGGECQLDLDRARSVVAEWLTSRSSGMNVEQFAEGVIRVVNANMERALRVVSIERGYDPREFALVAFGGAGALHACELADALSMQTVIVPAMPGAVSAYGILISDVVKDLSRTVLQYVSGRYSQDRIINEFESLEQRARKEFREEKWTGKPRFDRSLDLRYRGQGYELNLPFTRTIMADFHAQHQRRYGYAHRDREVEIVTVRLRAVIPPAKQASQRSKLKASGSESGKQGVVFNGRQRPTTVVERDALRGLLPGPAVVTEYSATSVVPPGWQARRHASGNLVLSKVL